MLKDILKNIFIPMLIPILIIMVIVVILAVVIFGDKLGRDGFDSSASGFVGDTVEERVWWALKDNGFNNFQAAAVLGNMAQESGFDPKAGSTSNSIGLCQWKYEYLGKNLEEYAKSKGTTWEDEDTQIEFLIGWIANKGPAADKIDRSCGPLGGPDGGYTYGGVTYEKNAFNNFTPTGDDEADIEYCTKAFCANYERCGEGDANFDNRISNAKSNFNKLKSKKKPTNTAGGSEKSSNSSGIRGYFKAKCSGRTFTEYYQNDPCDWQWDQGCWVCSQCTIMSGFGSKYTPNQIPGFHGAAQQYTWKQYGNCEYERITNVKASDIKKYLKEGNIIHIRVEGRSLITDSCPEGHYFGGHSMVLLDYKVEGGKDKVYLHDPWDGDPTYGWTDLNTLASCLTWYERVWQ